MNVLWGSKYIQQICSTIKLHRAPWTKTVCVYISRPALSPKNYVYIQFETANQFFLKKFYSTWITFIQPVTMYWICFPCNISSWQLKHNTYYLVLLCLDESKDLVVVRGNCALCWIFDKSMLSWNKTQNVSTQDTYCNFHTTITSSHLCSQLNISPPRQIIAH